MEAAVAENYKAGFVTLIGMPNVGKSSLLNCLVGKPLSIVTPKAHTTRERLLGVLSTKQYQLIFCDTPGFLSPAHALQEKMHKTTRRAMQAVEGIIFMAAADQAPDPLALEYLAYLQAQKPVPPWRVALTKIDLCKTKKEQASVRATWAKHTGTEEALIAISTYTGEGLSLLVNTLVSWLPVHPPYYPHACISDKSDAALAAEMLRKRILIGYKAEVPYSSHVHVTYFEKKEDILHIHATIYVARESQKGILIGAKGRALKGVGRQARRDLERFFGLQVYLKTHVEVSKNWVRDHERLKRLFDTSQRT